LGIRLKRGLKLREEEKSPESEYSQGQNVAIEFAACCEASYHNGQSVVDEGEGAKVKRDWYQFRLELTKNLRVERRRV